MVRVLPQALSTFPWAYPPAPRCVREVCSGSFPKRCQLPAGARPLWVDRSFPTWEKLGARKQFSGQGQGCGQIHGQFSSLALSSCLGPWNLGVCVRGEGGECSHTHALGTHLRWLCVGSGWGGPAEVACGTCPHPVSPAGELGVGIHPSCSGTAGMEGEQVTASAPTWVWLG